MADRDSFIDEVTEELRRDRMLRAWRRWGPWALGVVVVAVAAAGVASWMEDQDQADAEKVGGELIAAADKPDAAAQAKAFQDLATEMKGGPQLVARLSAAGAMAEAGETDQAVAMLETVQDDGAIDPVYRALAGFKAAMLRAPDQSPEDRAKALEAFVAEGAPFRLLALERRAAALIEAGDMAGASADIDAALSDPMLSPTLRQRLNEMKTLTGGGEG